MQELLEEFLPRVYRFALRLTGSAHDAEDLTQETLLRAWKNRRRLKHRQAARVWLFRIAANLWKDELRRPRARVADSGKLQNPQDPPRTTRATVDPCPAASSGSNPAEAIETAEELRIVLQALDSLPKRQREVLYLSAIEDLSISEVADILEISNGAVRTNLSLARKKMRERLRPAPGIAPQSADSCSSHGDLQR